MKRIQLLEVIFIISVEESSVYVAPCDCAERRAARCRWTGSDNETRWKGETIRGRRRRGDEAR